MNLYSNTILKVKGNITQQALDKSRLSYNAPTGHLINLGITRLWQANANAPTCPVKNPDGGSLTFIVRNFSPTDRDGIGFLIEAVVAKITKPINPPIVNAEEDPNLIEAPALREQEVFSFYYDTASDRGFFVSYEAGDAYIDFPHPDDMNPNLEPLLPLCLLDVIDEGAMLKSKDDKNPTGGKDPKEGDKPTK